MYFLQFLKKNLLSILKFSKINIEQKTCFKEMDYKHKTIKQKHIFYFFKAHLSLVGMEGGQTSDHTASVRLLTRAGSSSLKNF